MKNRKLRQLGNLSVTVWCSGILWDGKHPDFCNATRFRFAGVVFADSMTHFRYTSWSRLAQRTNVAPSLNRAGPCVIVYRRARHNEASRNMYETRTTGSSFQCDETLGAKNMISWLSKGVSDHVAIVKTIDFPLVLKSLKISSQLEKCRVWQTGLIRIAGLAFPHGLRRSGMKGWSLCRARCPALYDQSRIAYVSCRLKQSLCIHNTYAHGIERAASVMRDI